MEKGTVRTREQWEKIHQKVVASGMTAKDFFQGDKKALEGYYGAKSRLKLGKKAKKARKTGDFVQFSPVGIAAGIKITLPSGATLEIGANDKEALRTALTVLSELSK